MRFAYLGAPALVTAYGLARVIDGIDNVKGPGPAWTIGHLFFLAALGLFGVVMVGLRREGGRWFDTVALVGGIVGVVAMARVVVVDIVVAWGAADRAEMEREYPKYDDFPGLPDGLGGVLDAVGGVLFPLGLLVLLVHLAVIRRVPRWSPAVAAAGFVAILATLDFLPLAGVLLLVALVPLARGTSRSPAPASLRR
jgi:hypothetical protein